MKIQITGAQKKTYWYAEMIGQVLETDGHIDSHAGYRICGKTPDGNEGYVQLKDCVIVPEEVGAGITLLPDESLGGVMREYREVKRRAAVGELAKITDNNARHRFPLGEIVRFTTLRTAEYIDKRDWWAVSDTDYVVLDPTDILRINDERLRMVDRKASVGERVIIVDEGRESSGGYYYRIGNVGRVTDVEKVDIRVDLSENAEHTGNGVWHVSEGDYAVLEPLTPLLSDQPAQDQAAANIVSLALRLTQAEAKITALESAITERKVASGPVDNALPSFASLGVTKSAQEIRDEIVERAKADVKALSTKYQVSSTGNKGVSFWPKSCAKHGCTPLHYVDFIIDRNKRTVVALIRYLDNSDVDYRGIAKCAPGDVLNVHIGRAISLRRALGLTVPAEYLSVPAPEEVRVGDVVTFSSVRRYGTKYVVTSLNTHENNLRIVASSTAGMIGVPAFGEHLNAGKAIILDDSREDGGVTAAPSPRKEAA